jgi:AcrR family transcriptional regulator
MARTNKEFDNKRNELLKSIWDIFIANGYENTTLAFIIKTLNISKGAFYHYFSSKEECANAAIEMQVELWIDEIEKHDSKELKADARFEEIILNGIKAVNSNRSQNEKMDTPANAVFHQKLMVSITKRFAPFYADIILQGIKEGIFHAKYPLETAEMILTLSNFYLDMNLFKWDRETIASKVCAFEEILTQSLGAEKNTFSFISNLFELEEK